MTSRNPNSFKLKKRGLEDFDSKKRKRGRPKKDESTEDRTISLGAADVEVADPMQIIDNIAAATPEVKKKEEYQDIYSALSEASGTTANDGDVLDPIALMNLAISSDLDASVFSAQSYPVAPNIIEWCRNPNFLGYTGELWSRQIQVLAMFFGDVCYHCSDTEYVHETPVDDSVGNVLDRYVLLEHGICPKCRRNRIEMLADWIVDPRFSRYNDFTPNTIVRPVPPNEFVGVWGQRSGKSYLTSTFAAPYILHRYLSLPSPPRYFTRPANIVLEACFVAPTIKQITENVWMPFREAYETSPWFKEVKQDMLDEGKRVGVPLYHAAQTFILFPGKRISLNIRAANTTNLRGSTRIFATLDELGWFNTTEDGKRRTNVKDGIEVFTSLSNSLVTIRTQANKRRKNLGDYNALDAYMFNISSPSSAHDPIMQRAAVAPQNPRMLYTHYPTWEVNRDEDEDTIREETAGNLARFKRDFCAIPPRAVSPFFPDHEAVRSLIDPERAAHAFTYKIREYRDETGLSLLRPMIEHINVDYIAPRIIGVDNGEVDNSFALAIARYDHDIEGLVYEDFLEVAPYNNFRVDLRWCYEEVIVPLVQAFNPLHVVFDRWNSAHAVIDLRSSHNVQAERYTMKAKDWEEFRKDLHNMRVRFPEPEVDPDSLLNEREIFMRSRHPSAHFLCQLTTVEQFGKKVMKPENGTDDLFRAASMMHALYRKESSMYIKHATMRRRISGGAVGLSRSASGQTIGGRFGGSNGSSSIQNVGAGPRSSGAFYNRPRRGAAY